MSEKAELIITALQERIGQLVANYETQIAILRAELTQHVNKEKAVENYSEQINEIIGE
jgi:hypothetical protein